MLQIRQFKNLWIGHYSHVISDLHLSNLLCLLLNLKSIAVTSEGLDPISF